MEEIKNKIHELVPEQGKITKIEFEGPEISVYTEKPEYFFNGGNNTVSNLAKELKKRINVRTDKSLNLDNVEAEEKIRALLPEDAGLKRVYFNDSFSEVVLEALKPGLVIGKGGETSKRIIVETGWTPKIIRAPTQDSKTLTGIRYYLHKHSKERKQILKETARKLYREIQVRPTDWARMTALGGFSQVGRSSFILETRHTRVLVDCGIDPASNDDPFPYLGSLKIPLTELDAVVISHAHLDHHGFLPYLIRMGYQGPVYCTEPTRELMALMQFDYINLMEKDKEAPYKEADVKKTVLHCIPRDYGEVTDIAPDLRMAFYNSAHILGAASVHFNIAGGSHNLLYSSDFKFGFTRLFNNIELNYPRLETLILEGTTSGKADMSPNRMDSEERLLQIINDTISRGGNVLIPAFAVGRSQEMMLVLENFYKQNLLPADVNVYVDGMTKEASAIHTAYPEFLRDSIRRRVLQNDSPFTSDLFKEVPKNRAEILEKGRAIIIASSGMLTGGSSLDYFYRMAEDEKNTLLIVGYQAEGSLGRKLQKGVRRIPIVSNGKTKMLDVKMRIETALGFSGHSDRKQLLAYLNGLKPRPRQIILDHGEQGKLEEFGSFLSSRFNVSVKIPENLEAIRLM